MEVNSINIINDEILAAIAAAIASMETRPGYKLVVRSIRHASQTTPVWNRTGRLERISNNLNA